MSDPGTGESAPSVPAGRGFRRAAVLTYASNASILGLNLVTGILVARALGVDGRGELTAITTAPLLIAWIAAFGANQAVTYHQSRHPEDAPRLLTTWMLLVPPLAAGAVVAGEILIPHLLSAQTPDTIHLARLYMLSVVLSLAAEPLLGFVLGDQHFGFFNAIRIAQPLLLAVLYLGLWASGHFTVGLAVLANIIAAALVLTAVAQHVLRRHGFGRPSGRLARTTLWYGARAHGDTVAALTNTRLDLFIMPAFLTAVGVGLYAVATSVASMAFAVCSALPVILMPTAAREGAEGFRRVVASLQATLIVGTTVAAVLAVVAGPAVRLVYGDQFAGSVTPLRLLLPGTVLFACALVLNAGLYALNRPFTAFLAQLTGTVITVPALILFLPRWGITAAAVISSISYAAVFVATLLVYKRAAHRPWADLAAEWSRVPRPTLARLRRVT